MNEHGELVTVSILDHRWAMERTSKNSRKDDKLAEEHQAQPRQVQLHLEDCQGSEITTKYIPSTDEALEGEKTECNQRSQRLRSQQKHVKSVDIDRGK